MKKNFINAGLEMGSTRTHQQNSHQPSLTRKIRSAVSNKRMPSLVKVQAGNIVKVSQAKAVSKDWIERRRTEDILSRIIRFEGAKCKEPSILDLLGHFSRQEIQAVYSDLLWLYPDLEKKNEELVIS